jgi:hypothetical protein
MNNNEQHQSNELTDTDKKSISDKNSVPDSVLLAQRAAISLTGKWKNNDGGIYYLRQIGKNLWWYGEQSTNNPLFSNVFYGEIYDILNPNTLITGRWTDVPKGRTTGGVVIEGGTIDSGLMTLQVTSANTFIKTGEQGGFGGSRWTRI